MKIKEAKINDCKELSELEKEWSKEKISPLMVCNNEKELIKELKNSSIFLIKINNKIVAYLVCKIRTAKETERVHDIKKGEKYADIDSIYVKKNYRNKGLGSKLLKHCLKKIKKAGYKRIILSADSTEMNKLVNFYEKHGFKTLFTRMMKKNGK